MESTNVSIFSCCCYCCAQVLLTFLEYRGRCEMGRKEWQSVLDDNFELRMPITPYRNFPPQQVSHSGHQTIRFPAVLCAGIYSMTMPYRLMCCCCVRGSCRRSLRRVSEEDTRERSRAPSQEKKSRAHAAAVLLHEREREKSGSIVPLLQLWRTGGFRDARCMCFLSLPRSVRCHLSFISHAGCAQSNNFVF